MSLPVSIIIPAFNASKTIGHTLLSLSQQTARVWEAIIVDDGSSDNTVQLVNEFIGSDKRIRLVSQANQGASAARNHGLSLASYDFILFLDADDWIADDFLEAMTEKLKSENADAVVCCWARVDPSGNVLQEYSPGYITNLFTEFQQRCVFAIHSCIVRKDIVMKSGGFDTSLRTCGDWDMWLRVVRSGARFCELKAVKAFYRVQVQSLSMNGRQLLKDGMTVITRGHTVDERILCFSSPFKNASEKLSLNRALLHWTAWVAGLLIDSRAELDFLFADLTGNNDLELEPVRIANCLFYAATLPAGLPFSSWKERWPAKESLIRDYLNEIALRSGNSALTERTLFQLQQLIVDAIEVSEPVTIGSFYVLPINVEEEIPVIVAPANIKTIVLKVLLRNHQTVSVELPVIDNKVCSWTIKDAISLKNAWEILGEYFAETIYVRSPDEKDFQEYHNSHGWLKFLQELWNNRDASMDVFYGSSASKSGELIKIEGSNVCVEVSSGIPDIRTSAKILNVQVLAGGSAVGSVELEPANGLVTAERIRAAINITTGFELCRICVRQAIIGLPFQNGISLRDRLQRKAGVLASKRQLQGFFEYLNLLESDEVPQSSAFLSRTIALSGLSSSRRVQLPFSAGKELEIMSTVCAENWHSTERESTAPISVIPAVNIEEPNTNNTVAEHLKTKARSRHVFENCFTSKPGIESHKRNQYEKTRIDELIVVLGDEPVNSTLELSSGDVNLSKQLAERSRQFHIAYANSDMQPGEESMLKKGISISGFEQLSTSIPDQLDRIVCHDSLYYSQNLDEIGRIATTLTGKLRNGGRLVLSHSNLTVDNPDKPGFDWPLSFGAQKIAAAFNGMKDLQLDREVRSSLYSIQVFEKRKPGLFNLGRKPVKYEQKPDTELFALPASYAATLAWSSAPGSIFAEIWRSTNLPILRYNTSSRPNKEQLVSFEEQLLNLRANEYYSAYWFDWQKAVCRRQPLPGKPLVISFDRVDFESIAMLWPLVRKYGFTATAAIDMMSLKLNADNEKYWSGIKNWIKEGLTICAGISERETVGESTVEEFVETLSQLRTELSKRTGCPVNLLYYAGNAANSLAAHLAGGCGFSLGLTDMPGTAGLHNDLMQLPAIPMKLEETVKELSSKLE